MRRLRTIPPRNNQMKWYLLSIEELNNGEEAEKLCERAMRYLDAHREEKARRLKAGSARNLSVGAGLLLQLAAGEAGGEYPSCLEVSEVLRRLEERGGPTELVYRYGAGGKPDFADRALHFNLSHSGQYVCCVLDEAEVGVDIQQMRIIKSRNLVERRFSAGERAALEACENEVQRTQLFYRIWVRKESYAKLTGEGIAAVAGLDTGELEQRVCWQEYTLPEGYCMAVCQYRPPEEMD